MIESHCTRRASLQGGRELPSLWARGIGWRVLPRPDRRGYCRSQGVAPEIGGVYVAASAML